MSRSQNAKKRSAATVVDDPPVEEQQPSPKRPRIMEDHELVEVKPSSVVEPDRIEAMLPRVREIKGAPKTLDELLAQGRIEASPTLHIDKVRRIKAIFLQKLLAAWESSPSYFKKNKLNPGAFSLKFTPHPDKSVPSMTGVWSMGGPKIRTPLLLGAQRATITPGRGRREKEMQNGSSGEEKKGTNSTGYYLNVFMASGDNPVAKEQHKYVQYLQDEVTTFLTMLMLRVPAKSAPNFAARDNALRELIEDRKKQWVGKYMSANDIPLDDAKFIEHRNLWRSTPAIMTIMNQQLMVDSADKPITFTASGNNWKEKIEWVPLRITYVQVRDGEVVENEVPDETSVYHLLDRCPYAIEHSLKVNFATNDGVYKSQLNIEKITFFPQLSFLMQYVNGMNDPYALTKDDTDALDELDAEIARRKSEVAQKYAPKTPAVTQEFASYSVSEA